MYQVSIHYYGRKLITRDCPAQGLLEWPQHKWVTVNRRPIGLKRAIALAEAQSQHASVTPWMADGVVFDNGKQPAIPEGWYPAEAQTA